MRQGSSLVTENTVPSFEFETVSGAQCSPPIPWSQRHGNFPGGSEGGGGSEKVGGHAGAGAAPHPESPDGVRCVFQNDLGGSSVEQG